MGLHEFGAPPSLFTPHKEILCGGSFLILNYRKNTIYFKYNMQTESERKTYFAKADYRGKEQVFGIKAEDRSKHIYVIGKTGMGKSVLLENMAAQDIQNGNGVAFIDPHGEAAATLLDYIPEERLKDVIHFAPFDIEYPISFNVMEDVGYDKRHLVVSGLISTFKKIWPDVWSSRMEYILANTLFALLEYPDSTLLDVNRMLVNKEFRKDVVDRITDPVIKSFWVDEFAKYTDRYTQEATPAIQNKIGQFVSNPLIRNIIGQPKSSFDFRTAMDAKKILIMNLSKGRIGDTNAKLIGSMLIIKIYLAAMSRADTTASEMQKLPQFYFFVDEFQSFANETFADILSESRKYKLSLTIAHQYVGQMPDEVREAVFGNVGTMIAFRVGAEDSELLEKEFSPTFMAPDMVSLGRYQIYLKLMIDGLASKPFSAITLPPIEKPPKTFKQEAIAESRKTYARPRAEVEDMIIKRHAPPPAPEKPTKPKEERRFESSDNRDRPVTATSYKKDTFERKPNERFTHEKSFRNEPIYREAPRPYVPKPEIHKPFKRAFDVIPERKIPERREVPQVIVQAERQEKIIPPRADEISLKTLNPQNKKTGTSSENADELRKTLAEALKGKIEEKGGAVSTGGEQNKKQDIPEIPEAELKKILDVSPHKKM